MAWLKSSPSSRKTYSFHTQRLFIGISIGQESAWPAPEKCPGKTLDMIEKAESARTSPQVGLPGYRRIIFFAISSRILRTACDKLQEFNYRGGEGQIRSSKLTRRKLRKTNSDEKAEKQIHRQPYSLFRQHQTRMISLNLLHFHHPPALPFCS